MKISCLHISREGRLLIIYECFADEGPQEGINHRESGTGDIGRTKRMGIRVTTAGEPMFFFDKKMCFILSG